MVSQDLGVLGGRSYPSTYPPSAALGRAYCDVELQCPELLRKFSSYFIRRGLKLSKAIRWTTTRQHRISMYGSNVICSG